MTGESRERLHARPASEEFELAREAVPHERDRHASPEINSPVVESNGACSSVRLRHWRGRKAYDAGCRRARIWRA